MSGRRWDDVKDWFDPVENGSIPGLVIADTALGDLQALLTLIRTAGWRAELEQRDRRGEVPAAAGDLFVADSEGWLKYLGIWPADAGAPSSSVVSGCGFVAGQGGQGRAGDDAGDAAVGEDGEPGGVGRGTGEGFDGRLVDADRG